MGAEDTPWPMQGPAALTAEQVAVAAALLMDCSGQSSDSVDRLLYACRLLSRGTGGYWTVDELSTRNHHLEQMLREIEGVQL